MKARQGISLIVLVITIIVMIVLAGAIILTLNNSGIIDQASTAVDETNISGVKSQADLKYAEYIIDPSIIGTKDLETWLNDEVDYDGYYIKVYEKQTYVIKEGTLVDKYYKGDVKIGDYVAYDAGTNSITLNQYVGTTYKNNMTSEQVTITSTSSMKWRVLGAEGDKIKLVSEDIVEPEGKTGFGLYGAYSYLKGVEILNNACSVFGKGEYAISSRSITVDDIDEITGYDKTTYKSDMWGGVGTFIDDVFYGTKVNYNGKSTTINGKTYEYPILLQPDITAVDNNYVKRQEKTVTATAYYYDPINQMGETGGSSNYSEKYKLLFRNKENTRFLYYWIATDGANVHRNYIDYGMFYSGNVIACQTLRIAGTAHYVDVEIGLIEDMDSGGTHDLRPVVILEGNLQVVNRVNNTWEII